MDHRTGSPNWTYVQSWPGLPADIAAARHFVAQHLEHHDLHRLVDGATLVVSELASNAVRHAATPFTVTIEHADGTVVIGVDDGSESLPRQMPWDRAALSGRGLLLVGALAQEYGVTPHGPPRVGKLVWARFGPT